MTRREGKATLEYLGTTLLYCPDHLFDQLQDKMAVNTDARLAKRIRSNPSTIYRMRRLLVRVGASYLVSLHEETGLTIAELKNLLYPGSNNIPFHHLNNITLKYEH